MHTTGPYCFGVSREKPTREQADAMERAAKRHGAVFVETTLPGTGYQRWFEAPNRGEPFNRDIERAVLAELDGAK